MPTYEYKCDECGAAFDRFQAIIEDPIPECLECDASAARRLISAGQRPIFRGTGFYETDYARKERVERSSAESAAGGEQG